MASFWRFLLWIEKVKFGAHPLSYVTKSNRFLPVTPKSFVDEYVLNLTVSTILCFFATSNASSNDPVIFHLLLLSAVEIPKIKINLIINAQSLIVFNALYFGLCHFIQLTVMLLSGSLKNENNTQRSAFLYFGVLCDLGLFVTLQKWKCSF